MIVESWPWKRDLAQRAEAIRRRKQQRRWSEGSFAALERDIFQSAYAVRKLMEAGKISDEVESSSLKATVHKPHGRAVDIMNRHRFDELYDLSRGSPGDIPLRDFCNQVIHSFVFSPAIEKGGALAGIFVASDREKGRRLRYFDVDTVIDALVRVAEDDIVSWRGEREKVSGEVKITRKSNSLEAET